MNNFEKLKKKTSLGKPPNANEIKNNLILPELPEIATDGRSLRKTGRTCQLATKVTDQFHQKIKMIAARDKLKINELLEKALEIYENEKG